MTKTVTLSEVQIDCKINSSYTEQQTESSALAKKWHTVEIT